MTDDDDNAPEPSEPREYLIQALNARSETWTSTMVTCAPEDVESTIRGMRRDFGVDLRLRAVPYDERFPRPDDDE